MGAEGAVFNDPARLAPAHGKTPARLRGFQMDFLRTRMA
jgi:hypothetical protein